MKFFITLSTLAALLMCVSLTQAAPIGNAVISRTDPTDGATDVLNILSNAAVPSSGQITSFSVYHAVDNLFHAYVLRPLGGEQYTVLADVPINTAGLPANSPQSISVPPINVNAGDVIAHWGPGIPFDSTGIAIYYPSPQPPSSGLFNNSATTTNQFFRTYSFGANLAPTGQSVALGNTLQAANQPTDGATDVLNVYHASPVPGLGSLDTVSIFNQTGPGSQFSFLVFRPTANPNEYNVIYNSGVLTVANAPNTIETFALPDHNGGAAGSISVQSGDVIGHYGYGIPFDFAANADKIYFGGVPLPAQSSTVVLGTAPYPELAQERVYRLQANFTPVPEPASWLLAGVALVGLVGVARRRK